MEDKKTFNRYFSSEKSVSEEKLNNEIQGDANRKMGGKKERKKESSGEKMEVERGYN